MAAPGRERSGREGMRRAQPNSSTPSPCEERELKFLLAEEQYLELWEKLFPDAELLLQHNVFFDSERKLLSKLWAFRLRLEQRLQGEEYQETSSLHGIGLVPERAAFTVKGPARIDDGAVVRIEEEAAVDVGAARKIAAAGRLDLDEVPPAIAAMLQYALAGEEPPAFFDVLVEFSNLRLAMVVGTPEDGVEIALDRTETPDGRTRRELEVEIRGSSMEAARAFMQELGVADLKTNAADKLAFVLGR